jgi:hypothetical protein
LRGWVADYRVLHAIDASDRPETIYLAEPPARLGLDDRRVLLRVLEGATDARFHQLTEQLRSWQATRSPALVMVYEVGWDSAFDPPAVYVATENPGPRLGSPHSQRSEMLLALSAAAHGAHDLHEAGIVHGGICPGAVFVTAAGGRLDLPPLEADEPPGLVMRVRAPKDLDTLDPDIGKGQPTSRSTDVWSLGVTLHQSLTGEMVHPGLTGDLALAAVQRIAFEPPQLSARLDERAKRLISSCLSLNPGDRPSTAEELASAIEHLAAAP